MRPSPRRSSAPDVPPGRAPWWQSAGPQHGPQPRAPPSRRHQRHPWPGDSAGAPSSWPIAAPGHRANRGEPFTAPPFTAPRAAHPMTLVVLAAPEFDLDIALAYATPENVTGKPIYACAEAQLHPDAAAALSRAIALAATPGLRLPILAALRPVEAHWRPWPAFPASEFVTHPRAASHPSRDRAIVLPPRKHAVEG